MSEDNQDILTELYRATRAELTRKLRHSRLAPLMRDVGRDSRPGFTDLGVVTGFKGLTFVERFGAFLDKVTDAYIAALTLHLPRQKSLAMPLGRLAEHVGQRRKARLDCPTLMSGSPQTTCPPLKSQWFGPIVLKSRLATCWRKAIVLPRANLPPTVCLGSFYPF